MNLITFVSAPDDPAKSQLQAVADALAAVQQYATDNGLRNPRTTGDWYDSFQFLRGTGKLRPAKKDFLTPVTGEPDGGPVFVIQLTFD